MKRILSFVVVIMLVLVMVPFQANVVNANNQTEAEKTGTTETPNADTTEHTEHAKPSEEENKNNEAPATNPSNDQKPTEPSLPSKEQQPSENNQVKMKIKRNLNTNPEIFQLEAKLVSVKEAKGTWTYYRDGKKLGLKEHTGTTFTFNLTNLEFGQAYTIKVEFHGTVDGKETTVTGIYRIPGLEIVYEQLPKHDKFTGKITNATEAQGNWAIIIADEEGNIVDMIEKENVKGLTFSHAFASLDAGTYEVGIFFAGTVDGEPTGLLQFGIFEVAKKGKGKIKPPANEEQPKKPVDKKKVDQLIKKAKKGGPMPKTATNHPNGIAIGSLLVLVGIGLLVVLRFRWQS